MTFAPIILPFGRWTASAAVVLTWFMCSSCGGSPPTTPQPRPGAITLTCPANMDAPSPGGAAVPVPYAPPLASGGTAPLTVTCTPTSNTTFPVGPTAVVCTATDASARQATCGFTVNVIVKPVLAHTRFLAFGDSLTEGKLSMTLQQLIDSPAHSYPAKLQALLVARFPEQQITLINEGRGGEAVTESGNRFEAALSLHRPQSVLLLHGINDLNSLQTGRVQATVDGLEDLVKAATSRGVLPFVASLPPLFPPKAGCPECVEPLNQRIRSMTAAKGAVFVDVHAAWGNRRELMGADGIHPTEAGYEVIATTFFQAIRSRLETPTP